MKQFEFKKDIDIAWCPGCGNFTILESIKQALIELGKDPVKTVFSSGIGQAAKMPQYINSNFFNGLHGRALPVATAVKMSNPELTVIAEGGDGDMYGEGGNHFIHTIRRNPDITHLVHNNMVYGLTKGQASPTSGRGLKTTLQWKGVTNEPFNPLAVALSLGATFVARGFSGDKEKLTELIKAAMTHKGYALIDIFHPCVSFNKKNSFAWYKQNTYYLDEKHDRNNRAEALEKAFEIEKYPLGILYQVKNEVSFEDTLEPYRENRVPLYERRVDENKMRILLEEYKI